MVPRMIRVVTQPLRSSPTEIPFLRYIARAVPSLPCPRFTPSRGPAMQISFSPRASVLYGASLLSRSGLFLPYAVDHSFRLSFLPPPSPPRPVVPSPLPSFRTWFSFLLCLTLSLPLSFLSAFRYLFSATVSHGRSPSSSSSFPPRTSPAPAVFHSATPPTPPPSRPIQSPPRHPSFTASVAAYRLSFCHCGLFDILSTAVRTEARLSRGRREILETNDGERKKSRTWEPILAPASRRF